MEKNKCQVISWEAIPTDVLILTYSNEFNCDFRHKKNIGSVGRSTQPIM